MAIDLQAISDTLKTFAQDGTGFIYVAALGVGVVLGLMGLIDIVNKGKKASYVQEKGWGAISMRLVIASCLITLAQKLDMIIATNGDSEPIKQALAYAQGSAGGGASGPLAFIWAVISAWMVFLGTAGFMRGFLLLDKASQGGQDSGDNVWRALWHIVGGALCVNIFL